MQDDLRQTLLFASALQVLGPEHNVAKRLESVVRSNGRKIGNAVQQVIEELPTDQREKLIRRFEYLRSQLPDQALISSQRQMSGFGYEAK